MSIIPGIEPIWPHLTQRAKARRFTGMLPHYLYRCYAADGLLLYIGCTDDPARREKNHRSGKGTGASALLSRHMVTFEADATPYPNRDAGQQAEAEAIFAEQPLFNIHHRCIPMAFVRAQIADYEAGRPVRQWERPIYPSERLAGPEPTTEDLRDAARAIDVIFTRRGGAA